MKPRLGLAGQMERALRVAEGRDKRVLVGEWKAYERLLKRWMRTIADTPEAAYAEDLVQSARTLLQTHLDHLAARIPLRQSPFAPPRGLRNVVKSWK